jgi:hypothetical protein
MVHNYLCLLYELWNVNGFLPNALDKTMLEFLVKDYQKIEHNIKHIEHAGEKALGPRFNVWANYIGFTKAQTALKPITFKEAKQINRSIYPIELFGHLRHSIDYDSHRTHLKKNFFRDIHKDIIKEVNNNNGKILVNYSHEGWVGDSLFRSFYEGIKEVNLNPKNVILVLNDITLLDKLKTFLNSNDINIDEFPIIINYCYYVTQSAGFVDVENKINYEDYISNKKFKFLSLNRRLNLQRFLLLINLYDTIKDNSSISFDKDLVIEDVARILNKIEFPNCLTESDILLFEDAKEKLDKLPQNSFIDTTELNSTTGYNHQAWSPFKDSWISLVTETSFFHQNDFLSEKTWKPLWYFQPFIVTGRPYTLRYMKELGYKTFDWLFDESYDAILDNGERINFIIKEIKRVNEIPFEELKELILNNKETLIHNHNLLEKYGNNRKYFEEKLIDILNNNIDFVYYDLIKEEKTYEIA